jgi:hypothetical protein
VQVGPPSRRCAALWRDSLRRGIMSEGWWALMDSNHRPPPCEGDALPLSQAPDVRNPDLTRTVVERQSTRVRMSMRRFTRLTNAFSKKVENHAAAIALYFMYYNLGRIHQTLRVTPAMEAGVANHVWSVEEIVTLLS